VRSDSEMDSKKKQKREGGDSEAAESSGAEDKEEEEALAEEDDDEFDAKEFIHEEKSKLAALLQVLSEEELRRYEAARRSSLKPKDVEKTIELVLGRNAKGAAEKALMALGGEVPNIDERTVAAMNCLTKMHLAEVIEQARLVASERREYGRIQPKHIREAYRRMKLAGRVPGSSGGVV